MDSKNFVKIPTTKYMEMLKTNKKQPEALAITEEHMEEFDNSIGLKFVTTSHSDIDQKVYSVFKIKNRIKYNDASKYYEL